MADVETSASTQVCNLRKYEMQNASSYYATVLFYSIFMYYEVHSTSIYTCIHNVFLHVYNATSALIVHLN